ncbi:MAG: flagellar protein FlgN [Pseudomonadota bacterium]
MSSTLSLAIEKLLVTEHEVLSRLRDLLSEERSHVDHSPDHVLDVVEQKRVMVAQLEQLSQQRDTMLPDSPDSDLSGSLGELDSTGRLVSLFNDNLALAAQCKTANEVSGSFLHQRQRMVADSLALLCGDQQQTYTRRGITTHHGHRSLGSA